VLVVLLRYRQAFLTKELRSGMAPLAVFILFRRFINQMYNTKMLVAGIGAVFLLILRGSTAEKIIQLEPISRPLVICKPCNCSREASRMISLLIRLEDVSNVFKR